ncbi:Cell division protein FtsK [Candidatus Rhodobacter oscarellae]|uniref:DNA translocase FtsK n=1 Tax=Candidatus Rhodobacter oscarellae TaxID=1675527 RepID=A0A0J9E7B3_9RHOB|nr:DNA translocase FtsK [Candidatus Rhodobacter lobularis]KMW58602.1 Cell division protein FtsK [Candidatus Rhodobacter lobularis]
MAAYQAGGRGRLLDSKTQATIERRSKELAGLVMLGFGVLTAMILGSYVPEDPSWLSVTDEPAVNLLGRFGATVASPLFIIIGKASWGIAIFLLAWGARFAFHRMPGDWVWRMVFAPLWIFLLAPYVATFLPTEEWTNSFGLYVGIGGAVGDMVLGPLIYVLPVEPGLALKIWSVTFAIIGLSLGLFVLGFSLRELSAILRFLWVSFILAYGNLMTLLGRGATGLARGAARGAQGWRQRRAERREAAQSIAQAAEAEHYATTEQAAWPLEPELVSASEAPPVEPKTGLRLRLPTLVKRAPVAEEPPLTAPEPVPPLIEEGEDRVSSRISDAIKARARQSHAAQAMRQEPPVIRATADRAKGPQPMILADVEPTTPGAAAPTAMTAPTINFEAATPQTEQTAGPMLSTPNLEAEPSSVPILRTPPAQKPMVQHSTRKAPVSSQAKAEAQPQLKFEDHYPTYETPPLSLLTNPTKIQRHHLSDDALEQNARMLETVLDDYGVKGEIVSVRPGPVVTMYELEPAPGLKASRVIGLADDIARSMSALSARVSTVPGRSVIGIELPNANREMCVLREVLSARDFGDGNQKLPLALGKDIGGDPVVANLAKMPHLLIAGTTGSGKSVAINTMILSLLYKLTPEECRLIMIDPKMLELSVYDGIPHLLSPVVTDPKKAVVALKWVVGEMEERYRKMSKMGVRNIEGYNGRVEDALSRDEMFTRTVQTGFDDDTGEPVFETEEFAPEKMPFIVVVVDEMADLMMVAGKEIEACIQRLAQMARASGIHLIMATQRPSVDVITGTIKANFPTRISFQVTSKIDSRTILGEQGAEQLLGMGDMLYMAGGAKITRVHGPFVSDEEVEEIVTYLKSFGPPEYIGGVVDGPDDDKESDIDLVLGLGGNTDGEDALYDQAVAIVIKDRKCSTSYIQRKLAIGYNKAARLVEQMEDEGLVSASNHVGKREILVPEQQ